MGIMAKRAELQEVQQQTMNAYGDLAKNMEKALEKQTESNAGLAEKSFESKRRDFEKFLIATKNKLRDVALIKSEANALLNEFRGFIRQWFKIFEEASLDPINNPLQADLSELDGLPTIDLICDYVISELERHEVKFIEDKVNDFNHDSADAKADADKVKRKRAGGHAAFGGSLTEKNRKQLFFDAWSTAV